MKYAYVAATLALLAPLAAHASLPNPPDTLWAVTYDAGDVEKAYRARVTQDGGYIICGSTQSPGPGDKDAYIIKTGPSGEVIWSNHYGGPNVEEVFDIQQTADGGYVAVGYTSTNTAGYFDIYFLKTDAGGDTLWTRKYGGTNYDYGYSVAETNDGGFIIAGRTSSYGTGARSAYFIRTDADGDTLWTRAHGGWERDEAYSIVALPAGGYMAAGYTKSFGAGEGDVWLIRLDDAGDTLWTKTFGGELDERAEDIRRMPDKGFIIAGRSNSYDPPYHDMYVVRVNAKGDSLWTRTYGGPNTEHAFSVSPTLDGGFITAGYTKSFGGGITNAYVVRCDAVGDTMWTKTIGGTGSDGAYAAEQIASGGYMVSGYTFSLGTGDGDAFLVELGPSGGCPRIQEVADVPSDEGGYVRIKWLASFYDDQALEHGIERYKIWRRVKLPDISLAAAATDGREAAPQPAGMYELYETGPLWEQVGQVPAVSESIYVCDAPTYCGPMGPGRCEGCFFISAHTGSPGEYFSSPEACGTSIDNLPGAGGMPTETGDKDGRSMSLDIEGAVGGGAGCRINFVLAEDGRASVQVFSVTGRKVATVLDSSLEAGPHSIDSGTLEAALGNIAPGAYFVRLRAASGVRDGKILVIR